MSGADREAIERAGVERLDKDVFKINANTLSGIFQIKPRSVNKMFNNLKYNRKVVDKNWAIFYILPTSVTVPDGIKESNEIKEFWIDFQRIHPDRSVACFCKMYNCTSRSFIPPELLITYLLSSEVVDTDSFFSLFGHFGPRNSLNYKISAFCLSLLLRGWRIGANNRMVQIIEDTQFLFHYEKNDQDIILNNTPKPYETGSYFSLASGEFIDLETFFDRYFPMETPSNSYLIDAIQEIFK